MSRASGVIDGEIPGSIEEYRIGPCRDQLAVSIDHLQRTATDRGECTILRRHIADDDESAAQHAEGRGEPRQLAGEECGGGTRRGYRTIRRQANDCGPGSLDIAAVV